MKNFHSVYDIQEMNGYINNASLCKTLKDKSRKGKKIMRQIPVPYVYNKHVVIIKPLVIARPFFDLQPFF